MKRITKFSVNYPITIYMIVLAVLLLGYISFSRLGMDLFPDLNNPRLFVEIKAADVPPVEMEQQFIENMESIIIRQRNVSNVYSQIEVGYSTIEVEYSWNTDMDEAFLDLQKSLTVFSQNDLIEEIDISQQDPNADPIMLIALLHPSIHDMDELRRVAENYIQNELIRLEGVAAVEILGAEKKEVVVEINADVLDAYGLNMSGVASAINSYNRNTTAGSVVEMGTRYVIKGVGEFQSIEDIGGVIVRNLTDSNQKTVPVFLRDIAKIHYRNDEPQSVVHFNQNRCLGLAVYKETKYNTVRAVAELDARLKDIRNALPGYELRIVRNQADFINTAISEVEQSALFGILLAVIVLFVFLRRIGTTVIISIAIPVSIIATFNLMYFNGLTLNIMTLGGLALGAGMLVDNAIVVMENIYRNLEAGMPLRRAAVEGTAQVGGAITASTITTIIVFLPVVYLHGPSAELFKDQAWTVAFSLLSSLVVAVLLIPTLSSKFLKTAAGRGDTKAVRMDWYRHVLDALLERRWMVLLAALVLLIVTILLLPLVGSEFLPKTPARAISVVLKLPEDTALQHTEKVVTQVEKLLKSNLSGKLDYLYTQIGQTSSIGSDVQSGNLNENEAELYIAFEAASFDQTYGYVPAVEKILATLPDVDYRIVRNQSALATSMGSEEAPVVVEITGESLDELMALTSRVKERMGHIAGLSNIETNFEGGRRQVDVIIDRLQAGLNNLSTANIISQLQEYLSGTQASEWQYQGEQRSIRVEMPEPDFNDLKNLVLSGDNRNIRLDEVARIRYSDAQRQILRHNQNRTERITAQIDNNRPLNKIIAGIKQRIADLPLPVNYNISLTGEEQKRSEAFFNLRFALVLSIILIYMVLAGQFESLVHPFTILLTIPLAAVGAVLLFLILGLPLNIMAYIGIIMLVGIAVNDSIILVDAINQLRASRLSLREAILEAGVRRIRPIIMTSLTTVLALLPLTFGFGEGAALRAPMALAVIGGLITSTILTLVVIPCAYMVLDKLRMTRPVSEPAKEPI